MNRSPAFQFYPDKWQSHTRRLSDSGYRVYHELLCWMWQHAEDHCSIQDSPEAVACAVAMPLECVRIALSEIQNPFSPLLKKEAGRLVSNGLRKEASKQGERRDKAKTSATARWNDANAMRTHTKMDANAFKKDAFASSEQCFPTPTPAPTPKEEEEPSATVVPASKKPDGYHADARTVLHLLNESTGRHYRETDGNLAVISARLKEPDVDLAGVRKMVARQCALWKDGEMSEYLRPETLFNKTKFDSYYAGRDASIQTNQPHANTRPNPTKPHRNDFIAGANTGPSTTEILRRRAEREARERLSAAAGPVASQVAQVESVPPDDSGSL